MITVFSFINPTTVPLEGSPLKNLTAHGNLTTEEISINQVGKSSENQHKCASVTLRKIEGLYKVTANQKRLTSLFDSPPAKQITKIEGMEINSMEILNPEIPTKNRFSLFAECINKEQDNTNNHTNSHMENNKIHNEETAPITNPTISKPRPIKSPPIYVHGNINHQAIDKYKTAFQAKYTSNKLKIMFDNINSSTDFKAICKQENIEFHTYTVSAEKTCTVVLKELIKLPESRIYNSIKNQRLNACIIACTKIPTLTRYPIYRVTFVTTNKTHQIYRTHTGKNLNPANLRYNASAARHMATLPLTAIKKQFA